MGARGRRGHIVNAFGALGIVRGKEIVHQVAGVAVLTSHRRPFGEVRARADRRAMAIQTWGSSQLAGDDRGGEYN